MKAMATLAAVLTAAAAAIATAGAPEKAEMRPGVALITPPTRAVSGARSLGATKPSAPATLAENPQVHLVGPSDVDEGDPIQYEMSVSNDGDADLPGPFTVEFGASPAFDDATVTANGWSCSVAAHTCTWPDPLPAGEATAAAVFDTTVAPPHSPAGDCPERSPCVYMRALVTGYPGSIAVRSSAVIVDGHVPPNAVDDSLYMPATPAPVEFDPTLNDQYQSESTPSLEIVAAPTDGTVSVNGLLVTYTPGPGFSGTDTFRYRITDSFGGTDTAIVNVGPLAGGIAFPDALIDIGQVEIDRVAMRISWIDNTTGVDLYGSVTVSAVDPAEIPVILAGTGYDPSQAVFDPTVFRPRDGDFLIVQANFANIFATVKPKAPLGTVWLARVRLTMSPVYSPTVFLTAETVLVARSATAAEAPVHARDDVQTVPADAPTILHPLVNDDAVAGVLAVTGLSSNHWFEDDGETFTGTLDFAEGNSGVLFTPQAGFEGPTRFYYLMSAIVDGFWVRYDAARFDLNVGGLPAPPTAVASGSATICAGASTPLTGSGGVSCSWSPATGLDDATSCTPTASPASTTTYTLTVRDQHNQPSTNNPTVTVTVDPLPIAVASGTTTITLGQSTPLSGSGGASCSWSPATGLDDASSCTPMASPIVTTTYSLVVASAAGCVSTNAATATITVLPPTGTLDLVIADVAAPAEAEPGDTISVSITTQNASAAAVGASTTRLYLSLDNILDATDPVVGSASIPGLAAGATHVFTVGVTMPLHGNRFLIAVADADGEVPETNESNNTRSAKVKVKRPH